MRSSRSACGSRPVTGSTRTSFASVSRRCSGDVLRGVDEAAEDDGVEAVPEERLDLAHGALKLPVVRGIQRFRAARELQQPAARRFRAPFGLRAGAEVERHRIVVVALIEDGAASHLVHVLAIGRVDGGPAAQRRGGRGGTRRDAAQQRERRPVPHPALALLGVVLGHVLVGEGEDVVEERAVAGAEGVRGFLVPALGERGVCLEIAADVGPAALHEVAGEPAADAVAFGPVELLHRQVGEIVVEQGEERSERFLVAAVRRGGDQDHVAGGVGGDAAQELVALLAAAANPGGEGAAVRFVDDHELGAPQREVLGAARGLDEVGGHDGERVPVEDRYAERQIALQALDGARQHQLRFDVELLRKLALPLFGQVRRAQHRDAADLAAVEQLAGDEARLDGLADADVVGDEHAHRIELQRHHQRHELVGPGLDRDAPEAAEGAGGGPGGEACGIAQEPAGGEVAEVFAAGEAEGCGFDRFDGGEDAGDLLVEPADGAEHQEIGGGFREHDPLAAACVDEGAGGEGGGCGLHDADHLFGAPKTSAWRRNIASQSSSWWNRMTM